MHNNEKYEIIRSHRHSISLEMRSSDANIVVRAPFDAPIAVLQEFVDKHRDWIKKKREIVISRNAHIRKIDIRHGGSAPFLGEWKDIVISEKFVHAVGLDNGKINICAQNNERAKLKIIDWYAEQTLDYIQDRLLEYAMKYEVALERVTITSARRRWGSARSTSSRVPHCPNPRCSVSKKIVKEARGRLSFSWRLIMLPQEVVDYVLIHELTHLTHLDHSLAFWKLLGERVPEYRAHRARLRDFAYLASWE